MVSEPAQVGRGAPRRLRLALVRRRALGIAIRAMNRTITGMAGRKFWNHGSSVPESGR